MNGIEDVSLLGGLWVFTTKDTLHEQIGRVDGSTNEVFDADVGFSSCVSGLRTRCIEQQTTRKLSSDQPLIEYFEFLVHQTSSQNSTLQFEYISDTQGNDATNFGVWSVQFDVVAGGSPVRCCVAFGIITCSTPGSSQRHRRFASTVQSTLTETAVTQIRNAANYIARFILAVRAREPTTTLKDKFSTCKDQLDSLFKSFRGAIEAQLQLMFRKAPGTLPTPIPPLSPEAATVLCLSPAKKDTTGLPAPVPISASSPTVTSSQSLGRDASELYESALSAVLQVRQGLYCPTSPLGSEPSTPILGTKGSTSSASVTSSGSAPNAVGQIKSNFFDTILSLCFAMSADPNDSGKRRTKSIDSAHSVYEPQPTRFVILCSDLTFGTALMVFIATFFRASVEDYVSAVSTTLCPMLEEMKESKSEQETELAEDENVLEFAECNSGYEAQIVEKTEKNTFVAVPYAGGSSNIHANVPVLWLTRDVIRPDELATLASSSLSMRIVFVEPRHQQCTIRTFYAPSHPTSTMSPEAAKLVQNGLPEVPIVPVGIVRDSMQVGDQITLTEAPTFVSRRIADAFQLHSEQQGVPKCRDAKESKTAVPSLSRVDLLLALENIRSCSFTNAAIAHHLKASTPSSMNFPKSSPTQFTTPELQSSLKEAYGKKEAKASMPDHASSFTGTQVPHDSVEVAVSIANEAFFCFVQGHE